MLIIFSRCTSLPGAFRKPAQPPQPPKEKPYREYSKTITTLTLIGVGVILAFSMVMIAVTGDTDALEWLIGFASAAGVFIVKYYMRRAAQKDNLEQRRKYGADVYNDANVPIDE